MLLCRKRIGAIVVFFRLKDVGRCLLGSLGSEHDCLGIAEGAPDAFIQNSMSS